MTTTDLKPNTSRLLPRALFAFGALVALTASSQAAILAAWDDFAIRSGSNITADDLLADFSATLVSGRFNGGFGSTDGTYGDTLSGANTALNGLLPRSADPTHTFSITNNTGSAYNIESINFDFIQRYNSAESISLTYNSGGLGPASTPLVSQTYTTTPGTTEEILYQYDLDLSSILSDIALGDGETANFTFSIDSALATNSAVFDNLAIQGSVVPEPSTLALVGLMGGALLLRRRRAV
jgi:hypothetical protein